MTTHSHKVRRVQGHECSLPQEDELITLYINGGLFVDFRRRFRQYLMVSAANPESKTVLKSTAQIRLEESRHLRRYYHMIHPFSEARMTWEMIMIVVYTSLLVLMPLELGIPITESLILYSKFFLDLISLMDIALFFCTGYFDVRKHKIILKPTLVLKNYLFPFFFFDLISSLPYNMYIVQTKSYDLRWLKFFYLVKLTRLPTLSKYIRKFCIRMELYSYKLSTVNFALWFFTAIWWATAITLLVYSSVENYSLQYYIENPDIFNPTLESCYQVVRAFMLVAMSKIQTDRPLTMIFNIICILIGSVLNMVILAQVMQIYKRHSSSRNKYDNLLQEIAEYMNYKELPPPIKNRVFRYVEFKFQKNIFKEADILNTLSKILKQDILLHNCKKMVEKVDFFKGLPGSLILRLVTKLRSEIYLPNDLIVQAGIPGNAMYFIYVGSVAVYTINEQEICHLEDGSYFGEISLVINEPRVASVIAITNCEVFRLSRKDFMEAMEPYPNLTGKIREKALSRLKRTKQMTDDYHQRIKAKVSVAFDEPTILD
ncbi:potassium/sodium hyperpolarization-activated cyclic nucleotide-gated channel 1 [Tribolium castaneum]|uniref:Potassium voltage-gated channel protein eag-like Protein n=1 Tax=Tribolium castaneum TaxID=7070 RepID=D6WUM2_TRICA|nr:PREDICTED: potassium/sodium hyperpolarization-activated cyclic nucleotide-gated channel 1 [Tribolium castaneum]EFA08494.1 Potassium voltage-gated channel protein eag-like Protein [Tribolium castaneum]|eukprot:XP_973007.1 PREDICTED: potassium/sodium hyperpolarization-activated cyclic nucleotide-gated channel 1 [Tribolium castaneum]